MSSSDAFTAVFLNQALNSAANYGASAFQGNRNNGQSNDDRLLAKYNKLAAQWNQLVEDYKTLRDEKNKQREFTQASYRQTGTLMAFINGGRLAQGLPALLYPQIEFAVDYDPQLKKLKDEMWECGRRGSYGVISKTDLYWKNINEQVFKPFAEGMINAGKVAPDHMFAGASRNDLQKSLYAEMSGWQKTQRLEDENAALKREVAELKQQLAARA